jgi:hypothetical protein
MLKRLYFSTVCFWHLCQEPDEWSCEGLFLSIIFCSIVLHVCFHARTMLCLLLWLCTIVWNQVLWYLQQCSFCSELLCLPSVLHLLVRFTPKHFVIFLCLIWMKLYSWYLFWCFTLGVYKKILIFVCWFCTLILCWKCLFVPPHMVSLLSNNLSLSSY